MNETSSKKTEALPAPAGAQGVAPQVPRRKKRATATPSFLKGKRTEIAAVIISLFVSIFFSVQVNHFQGRYASHRTVNWRLPFWYSLENLEMGLYDARFTWRGIRVPDSVDKIAIVGIDQMSLVNYKTWPWPRKWHADLIRKLKKAGAKVIALDMDFSDKQSVESDAALARAMADAGNVLLASFDATEDTGRSALKSADVNSFIAPLTQSAYDEWFIQKVKAKGGQKNAVTDDELKAYEAFKQVGLDEQTPDLAMATMQFDLDEAARRYPFRCDMSGGKVHVGGLATLAVAQYQGLMDGRENAGYEKLLAAGVWPNAAGAKVEIPLHLNIPPNPTSPVYYTTPINFWGPPGSFLTYSYSDVLGGQTYDENGNGHPFGFSDADLVKHFKDRIVFVGATTHILKDLFPAPSFLAGGQSKIPGVELHATMAAMLLDGTYIHTLPEQPTLILVYVFTLLSCLWTVLLKNQVNEIARKVQIKASKWGVGVWLHSWLWFLAYAVLASLPLFLFWQAVRWLFAFQNLWVLAAYPGGSAATASMLVLLMLFSAESVERRKTIAQLGAFMAPEVRDEILAHPENEYPKPRRVMGTMLFTDLEGFTTYSETHEPEEVVEALNHYFDRMVTIVRAHGGNVDKYIGDSIMALFGIPVPRHDHAAQALLCSIAMQEECARFREETGIEFYTRIGVHTGEVIAGSIGAQGSGHFNYTALGDNVNLASRLEGKNKEFGSWILCSAATYEAANGIIEAEHAQASIKGKSHDVEVFIVHGMAGLPEQDQRWGRELMAPSAGALTAGGRSDEESDTEMPALIAGVDDREKE